MYATDATTDPRYDKFIKTREKSVPVVCLKCGSQRLYQNSIDQIMCYDCGNVTHLDGTRFTIARSFVEHHDVLQAFSRNPV
jgi:ribosomal protein S27E